MDKRRNLTAIFRAATAAPVLTKRRLKSDSTARKAMRCRTEATTRPAGTRERASSTATKVTASTSWAALAAQKIATSVARTHQSFTRAAKELFVSQPAITKHINELERQYSVRLFDRTGGKIMLTDAGRLLLEHCSRILDEYNRMEYDMGLLNARGSGHISIGASTTIAQYVLPQILAEFTERYPKIEVSLANGNSRDIENALLNHEIDFGMVEGVTHAAGLQYEPFLEDELVTIVKAAGNESLPEELTPHDLRRLPRARFGHH